MFTHILSSCTVSCVGNHSMHTCEAVVPIGPLKLCSEAWAHQQYPVGFIACQTMMRPCRAHISHTCGSTSSCAMAASAVITSRKWFVTRHTCMQ